MAVLSDGGAQELMDELWRLGIRPTKGTARGEVEEAMRCHIEDLRVIVRGHMHPDTARMTRGEIYAAARKTRKWSREEIKILAAKAAKEHLNPAELEPEKD